MRAARLLLAASLAVSCGGPAPPPVSPAAKKPPEPEPESVEWLYVTDKFRGDRAAECQHVYEWVQGEKECKNLLCGHAAKLGLDWVKTCGKRLAGKLGEVRELTALYEQRSVAGSTACEDEAESLIRDGCKKQETCTDDTQRWATRCGGESATPLIVRMIELAVERSGARGFELDARSCKDLANEVKLAASCEPGFPCEDAMPKVATHRARCLTGGKLQSANEAFFEMAIAVGAGADTPAAPLDLGAARLDVGSGFVPLQPGDGAIVLACGRRVKTLEDYQRAQASCEGEPVLFARVFRGDAGKELRLGRVAVPSARAFRRRYPALAALGEASGEDAKMLALFTEQLDAAIAAFRSRDPAPAVSKLVQALVGHLGRVRHLDAFAKALTDRDERFVPLFEALGKKKNAAAKRTLKTHVLVPFVRRATLLPLADVNADGLVVFDSYSPASALTLGKTLPRSVAAYRAQLERAEKRAARRKVRAEDWEDFAITAGEEASKCGVARLKIDSAESALLDCAFGVEQCEDDKVASEGSALDRALRDTAAAHLKVTLAVSSLDQTAREAAEHIAESAGCEPPPR